MIHYNPHRWTSHLFDVEGSMVREITGRVALCVIWSAAVVLIHHRIAAVAVPSSLHTLVGAALGLLLVFRTNASYDRFWEGRKLWGGVVNESRNLGRSARAYLSGGAPDLADRVVLWAAVFPWAVRNSLRDSGGLGRAIDLLPADEADEVRRAPNVPLAVACRVSRTLVEARDRGAISDVLLAAVDDNTQLLIDYYGACQRINRTPLPFVYVVHLRRALIAYCFTVPFALIESFGWWTVPCTLLLTYTFFGIEEIGVEIEDPFGQDPNDLPLTTFCETIENDLLAMLNAPSVSKARTPAPAEPELPVVLS